MPTRYGAFFTIPLLLALVCMAWGQRVHHANAFLQIGRDAHHEALGRAAGAHIYWPMMGAVNPASLAAMPMRHVAALSYSNQFGGLGQLWSACYGHQLADGSGLEALLVYYGVSDIPNTLGWIDREGRMDDRRITRFDVADYAVLLSYGRLLPVEGLSLGGSLKLIYRHAGGFATGYGVGFEAGIRYALSGWSMAAVLHDATTTWTFWEFNRSKLAQGVLTERLNLDWAQRAEEFSAPSLSLYANRRFALSQKWHLGMAVRVHSIFGERGSQPIHLGRVALDPALGLWINFSEMVDVRLGIRQFQSYKSHGGASRLLLTPSGGLGVRFSGISLNYSFSAPLTASTIRFTHLVSVSFGFSQHAPLPLPVDGTPEMIRLGDS